MNKKLINFSWICQTSLCQYIGIQNITPSCMCAYAQRSTAQCTPNFTHSQLDDQMKSNNRQFTLKCRCYLTHSYTNAWLQILYLTHICLVQFRFSQYIDLLPRYSIWPCGISSCAKHNDNITAATTTTTFN